MRKGQRHTPETLAKMSAGRKGKGTGPQSSEHVAKRVAATKDKLPSRKGEANNKWRGDAVGSKGCHTWLRNNYPKAGRCDECGEERTTEYAFLGELGGWARDRDQYAELCIPCHRNRDSAKRKSLLS